MPESLLEKSRSFRPGNWASVMIFKERLRLLEVVGILVAVLRSAPLFV
jgi:hypothetical protein